MTAPPPRNEHLALGRRALCGDDPIFALDREARTRRAAGEDVVNAALGALLLDSGELAILPTAAQAMREVAPEDWAAYAPIEGHPAFLEAVLHDGLAGVAEDVAEAVAVATPGGTGALRHAIATFLEPGQALLTTDFHWGPYQTLADEQERALCTFRMFPAPKGGPDLESLDLESLDEALGDLVRRQGRVLLILNDPCHNPTGYSMSAADWAGVADIVSSHAATAPIVLVLDAAYAAFGPQGAMRTALSTLRRLADRALVLIAWSASKSFTHYGLRTGALIALVRDAKERVAISHALARAGRGTWGGCIRGGQVAVARLLREPALHAQVEAERGALLALLDARVRTFRETARDSGLSFPRYQGGFFTTVFSQDAGATAARMREEGVFVVPLPGGLRLGICAVPERQIPRTVRALVDATRSGA